jgi:hypothetical protein
MFKLFILLTLLSSHAEAKGSVMIEQVIQNYFQGYQLAETSLIKKAFHSETRLLSVDNNQLDVTEMKDWLTGLEKRKLDGDIRKGELKVLSIDQSGDSAVVKLSIKFPKFSFIDYLSLLRIDEKWLIVGKIYSVKEN